MYYGHICPVRVRTVLRRDTDSFRIKVLQLRRTLRENE